jgi:uncharacterized protein YeaO (DUF488 family)
MVRRNLSSKGGIRVRIAKDKGARSPPQTPRESSARLVGKLRQGAPGSAGRQRVRIKRIYEPPARGDGYRVLVDRLWPRGISKSRASLDAWDKELAPSSELREWFGHAPERWSMFRRKYRKELKDHKVGLEALKRRSVRRPVTLLYAAKSHDYNQARVLKEALEEM